MVKYIKQEMNDLNKVGKKGCYYRLERRGCVQQEDLIEQMCSRTGLNRGNVTSVLTHLVEAMEYFLVQGESVKIDELGVFSLSLGMREGKEVEGTDGSSTKRNAQSICVDGMNFRVNKDLIRRINMKCRLERGGTSRIDRSPFTKEERRLKAIEYLREHSFMRISNYVSLTKMSRTSASIELREFAHDPESGIRSTGVRSTLLYMLREQ